VPLSLVLLLFAVTGCSTLHGAFGQLQSQTKTAYVGKLAELRVHGTSAIFVSGDSETEPYGVNERHGWAYVMAQALFGGKLALSEFVLSEHPRDLAFHTNTYTGRSGVVYNDAAGGSTTADMLKRFDADYATTGRASVVIIFGGINDSIETTAHPDMRVGETESNLAAVVRRAHAASAKVVIATVPNVTASFVSPTKAGYVDQLNSWIRGGGSGADAVADVASANPEHLPDGVHLTTAGQLTVERVMQRAVRPLIPR
jgi:lysophospholipase L1-like esterase